MSAADVPSELYVATPDKLLLLLLPACWLPSICSKWPTARGDAACSSSSAEDILLLLAITPQIEW
jgi:hypothetical protein